jgi:hypothetical protein
MNGLPEGWVPLSDFDSKDRGRMDGHSPDYKLLAAAVKDGELRGLQDPKSRRYYVPRDEANKLLINRATQPEEKPSKKTASDLQYESVCESLGDIAQSLASVERLLGRLADAAEHIVTQPKEPAAAWREINGNPAPWNET